MSAPANIPVISHKKKTVRNIIKLRIKPLLGPLIITPIENPTINHVTNAGQIVSPKKIALKDEAAILAAENSRKKSAIKPEPSKTQIPCMNELKDPPEINGDTLFAIVNARYWKSLKKNTPKQAKIIPTKNEETIRT